MDLYIVGSSGFPRPLDSCANLIVYVEPIVCHCEVQYQWPVLSGSVCPPSLILFEKEEKKITSGQCVVHRRTCRTQYFCLSHEQLVRDTVYRTGMYDVKQESNSDHIYKIESQIYDRTHTSTHTHTHKYVYIYMEVTSLTQWQPVTRTRHIHYRRQQVSPTVTHRHGPQRDQWCLSIRGSFERLMYFGWFW
jgi:hypothetical protein